MFLAFAYFKPKVETSGMLQLITHYSRLLEEVYKIVKFIICNVNKMASTSQLEPSILFLLCTETGLRKVISEV